jgi:hypothetical protein
LRGIGERLFGGWKANLHKDGHQEENLLLLGFGYFGCSFCASITLVKVSILYINFYLRSARPTCYLFEASGFYWSCTAAYSWTKGRISQGGHILVFNTCIMRGSFTGFLPPFSTHVL